MHLKECPSCKTSLEGELIYKTFRTQGKSPERALEIATMYGATKRRGRWGRQIGHYDIESDRTVAWECPDCHHKWSAL